MAPNGTAKKGSEAEHTCFGVVEEAREKSAKRRAKPQPWVIRKFTILITIGIIAYAFYVYIGRLCVPMIRRDSGALGGRGMGIGFLVIFCALGLIMLWAYEKIVLTSPGYAKDYVQKSPAPVIENGLPTWWESQSEAELAAARHKASQPPQQSEPKGQSPRSTARSATKAKPDSHRRVNSKSGRKASQNGKADTQDVNAGMTDAIPPVAAAHAKATADKGPPARTERPESPPRPHSPSATSQQLSQPPEESTTHKQQTERHVQPLPGTGGASEQKPMMFTRKPPTTPILLPEYRYCHTDGFLKPLRAHHCRACGTCVLKYDHHCPWIGQCVGARNHRFFVIFVFWGLLFSAWTFATLVGLNARAASVRSSFEVDGQQVAIMVLSGLFILFTGALLWTHVDMIIHGQSTVESLGVRRMRERETRVLKRLHPWWDFRAKRQTRQQWDAEWGRIGKEGHPWWLGCARRNWEATMGPRAWMWFLPIGKSPDDGLSYELNPRFDSEGRWRPRKEWPKELQ
ncbi:DHHC palmitoyltransferase-domain-containing protein [Trametes punicea]|nr:DHHC palmitoyltransferase-domain-containing protein [Trametes punicea]